MRCGVMITGIVCGCVGVMMAADLVTEHKPLGGHRDPTGTILELEAFPSPAAFHHDHASGYGVPFVVRGGAAVHPAAALWTDDYLTEHFGDVTVEWEEGKKENRSLDLFEWQLAKYVREYSNLDGYCVCDLNDRMKADFRLPESLICGGYHRRLSSLIMWFSSGGTKSVLHNDVFENINCVLDGTKHLLMINRSLANVIETPAAGWDRQSNSAASIDVDAVDLTKFPALGQFAYTSTTLAAGDCVYIPSKWYHQVRSFGPRSLAINVWTFPMERFDSEDCDDHDRRARRRRRRLSQFGWLAGIIPDYADALDAVRNFADFEGFVGDGFQMTRAHFELVVGQGMPSIDIRALFETIDANSDGAITTDELGLDADTDADDNGDDGEQYEWHVVFQQAWGLAHHINATKDSEKKARARTERRATHTDL